MRIALVHNPAAGDSNLETDEIRRLLEVEGHVVQEYGKDRDDVQQAIAWSPDVLAVAGGDGTVARVATTMFTERCTIPLCVLAMGTANNIARSLGVARPLPAIIATLATAPRKRLDIGHIVGPWGARHFVEAAGVGFIGSMLRNPMSRAALLVSSLRGAITGTDIDERKARGVGRLVREQPARSIRVKIDGEDLSGKFVSVEAMNIREVGPNVCLAPDADPGDGYLDIALVGEEHRTDLSARVERGDTDDHPPEILIRRARRIELAWDPQFGHVDDEAWPDRKEPGTATICIAGGIKVIRD
jgi:diacylglycerol kinase family enzyme